MKAVDAIKAFFGTPDKPLTSKELMAFAKTDKAAYDEIKDQQGHQADQQQRQGQGRPDEAPTSRRSARDRGGGEADVHR